MHLTNLPLSIQQNKLLLRSNSFTAQTYPGQRFVITLADPHSLFAPSYDSMLETQERQKWAGYCEKLTKNLQPLIESHNGFQPLIREVAANYKHAYPKSPDRYGLWKIEPIRLNSIEADGTRNAPYESRYLQNSPFLKLWQPEKFKAYETTISKETITPESKKYAYLPEGTIEKTATRYSVKLNDKEVFSTLFMENPDYPGSQTIRWIDIGPRTEGAKAINQQLDNCLTEIKRLKPLPNTDQKLKALTDQIAEIHYLVCIYQPFISGTAGITDICTKALFDYTGIETPQWRGPKSNSLQYPHAFGSVNPIVENFIRTYGLAPDVEALSLPPRLFIENYPYYFEPPLRFKQAA